MAGKSCRALTKEEVIRVYNAFSGKYKRRNQALFILGCYTGYRIGELLSIRLSDVWINGALVDALTVKQTKTDSNRMVTLTAQPAKILRFWLQELISWGLISKQCFIFCQKNGQKLKYKQALRGFHVAYKRAGVYGQVASHSMRKTFVVRNLSILNKYAKPGDEKSVLMNLKLLTGHESIDSLEKYIPIDEMGVNNILKEYGNEVIL